MNDILDFYQQQAEATRIHSLPWVAQLQEQALKQFQVHGFPNRHHEEWKYTAVDELLQQPFAMSAQTLTVSNKSETFPFKPIAFVNNRGIQLDEAQVARLPEGVYLMSLAQMLQTQPERIQKHLGQVLKQEHAFHFLNTAMLQTGLVLYVPAGVRIEEPLIIHHGQEGDNQALYVRHLLILEPEAQAKVIELYTGDTAASCLTNAVTEIVLDKKAQLSHYKWQQENKNAWHFGHTAVKQNAESSFSSHAFNLGGKKVRADLSVYLVEEQAQCLMNGIYAPAEGQHIDHHTKVHHLAANCQSTQDYKGIISGRARAVFNGKVFVASGAQHTHAQQQNKNLLLSKQAEVDTKPQLEIYADDVICSHGATVGQLDEEALFYLATRGIGREQAAQYLIHAFAKDNIDLFADKTLSDYASDLLIQQLG